MDMQNVLIGFVVAVWTALGICLLIAITSLVMFFVTLRLWGAFPEVPENITEEMVEEVATKSAADDPNTQKFRIIARAISQIYFALIALAAIIALCVSLPWGGLIATIIILFGGLLGIFLWM